MAERGWEVREARDYAERRAVIALFQRYIPGVADDAVPRPENDRFWNPVVLVAVDADTVVGGLLTCRSPLSADAIITKGSSASGDRYARCADRLSMLDLLAVDEPYRRCGVGSALIAEARDRLTARDVRVWFGNVVGADDLARFYERCGFQVVPSPGRLPPFFGVDWDPARLNVELWFWQRLRAEVRSM